MLGGTAIAGCLIAVVADLVGVGLSDKVGVIQDTISDLAASKTENTPADELADIGIYAFVLSVLATTYGLLRWRIDRLDWRIGSWLLVVVAICVYVTSCGNRLSVLRVSVRAMPHAVSLLVNLICET